MKSLTRRGLDIHHKDIAEQMKQAPLSNVNERVNAVSLLLSVTLLSNWQNVLSQLSDDHI
jgi:hypothetical protein